MQISPSKKYQTGCTKNMLFYSSAYMDYHPGGLDELMRGAGIDATNLFNEVHRWVNYESMLKACLVGKLVAEPFKLVRPISKKVSDENPATFNKVPVVPPITTTNPGQSTITHDWYQTNATIVITLYTKKKLPDFHITPENVLVEIIESGPASSQKGRDKDSFRK